MPASVRVALIFLYGLLFASFSSLMYAQYVGHWLTQHFSGWVALGAAVALFSVIGSTIWAINRINRDWLLSDPSPSWSAPEALDMEYLIATSKPSPLSQGEISAPPVEIRKRWES